MAEASLITKLNQHLADQVVLYVKLRNYHWNITGPQFFNIHNLTEEYYEHLADTLDEVAERIRQLDETPLSTMQSYLEHTSLDEEQETTFTAEEVVKRVLADFQRLLDDSNQILTAAEDEDDIATADIMAEQIDWLEESIWMLKAFLG